jgi:hypothetical protein
MGINVFLGYFFLLRIISHSSFLQKNIICAEMLAKSVTNEGTTCSGNVNTGRVTISIFI